MQGVVQTANGEWHHTYVDDEVERGEMTELPEPVNGRLRMNSLTCGRSKGHCGVGYDRSDMVLSDIASAPLLLGRIYRYFLWNSGPNDEPIPGRSRPTSSSSMVRRFTLLTRCTIAESSHASPKTRNLMSLRTR